MSNNQNILLTTDCAIIAAQKKVLLIQRKNNPYKGQWALPGGFVEDDEDLVIGAARELKEETSVTVSTSKLKQFRAYGAPRRDPRGRTVSVVFYARVDTEIKASASDDAQNAQWYDLNDLPKLAFDHENILNELRDFLKI